MSCSAKILEFAEDVPRLYALASETSVVFHAARTAYSQHLQDFPDATVFIGDTGPDEEGARYQHRAPLRDVAQRWAPNGMIETQVRNATIVFLCSYWEDRYRAEIASAAGLKSKNDLRSEVFHDINKLRQGIIHAGAKLDRKLTTINHISIGDKINFSGKEFRALFEAVFEELNNIARNVCGDHLGLSVDTAMPR